MKYGYYNFILEILEYCDKFDLLKKIFCEQYYMNLLKPDYNVLLTAGSNIGFKHSEATKEIYRSTRLGIKCGKSLNFSDGEKFTHNFDKRRVFSQATRLKLSANNHKSISVILRDIEKGVIIRFPCKNKAAQFLGVSETTVRRFIIQQRTCKGYIISIE